MYWGFNEWIRVKVLAIVEFTVSMGRSSGGDWDLGRFQEDRSWKNYGL